jgi:phosphonate transport system substrate-binding protein
MIFLKNFALKISLQELKVRAPGVKSRSRQLWSLCFYMLMAAFMAACSQDDSTRTIETLNIGSLPDQNESVLRTKYQPLLNYLNSHTGLKSKLMIPESYEQLLQWFDESKVDIALFGGVTYVKAHTKNKAVPLVMRDVDGRFKSVAVVSANNDADNLRDLKGASLAFGSRLSTSGHFMPRYFLQKENIELENFFSKIEYSGAHDRTAEWVRDGKVEVGMLNASVAAEMFRDGRLTRDKVKIFWESPPYADYVWAIQPDINKAQGASIRDAFMQMNQDANHQALLKSLGANYFIPASHEDFSVLEQIILKTE